MASIEYFELTQSKSSFREFISTGQSVEVLNLYSGFLLREAISHSASRIKGFLSFYVRYVLLALDIVLGIFLVPS